MATLAPAHSSRLRMLLTIHARTPCAPTPVAPTQTRHAQLLLARARPLHAHPSHPLSHARPSRAHATRHACILLAHARLSHPSRTHPRRTHANPARAPAPTPSARTSVTPLASQPRASKPSANPYSVFPARWSHNRGSRPGATATALATRNEDGGGGVSTEDAEALKGCGRGGDLAEHCAAAGRGGLATSSDMRQHSASMHAPPPPPPFHPPFPPSVLASGATAGPSPSTSFARLSLISPHPNAGPRPSWFSVGAGANVEVSEHRDSASVKWGRKTETRSNATSTGEAVSELAAVEMNQHSLSPLAVPSVVQSRTPSPRLPSGIKREAPPLAVHEPTLPPPSPPPAATVPSPSPSLALPLPPIALSAPPAPPSVLHSPKAPQFPSPSFTNNGVSQPSPFFTKPIPQASPLFPQASPSFGHHHHELVVLLLRRPREILRPHNSVFLRALPPKRKATSSLTRGLLIPLAGAAASVPAHITHLTLQYTHRAADAAALTTIAAHDPECSQGAEPQRHRPQRRFWLW
ncbi:hypothetical protein K438DRAFT_1763195 [Mycena galopus ATCC 62051]|nr:hypothetical protein K438DRAFT_1763195 [Mycena galopus ATCC 62051]